MSLPESLVRDIVGLPPRKHEPAFDCETQIAELGVQWLAAVDYDCDKDCDGYLVSVDTVRLQPVGKPQAEWITVDFSELSVDSQETIESCCIERYCR